MYVWGWGQEKEKVPVNPKNAPETKPIKTTSSPLLYDSVDGLVMQQVVENPQMCPGPPGPDFSCFIPCH